MQMIRTRKRTDRFELRGWVYPFHELRAGASFARLEAETDEVQVWTLRTGREVEIRPGDVQLIAPQIGMPVPGRRRSSPDIIEQERNAHPELFSNTDTPVDQAEGEPLPDNLARLVPETVEQAERKVWLRERWQMLTHRLVDGGKALEPLAPTELVEQQELERYRGFFS